MRNNKYYIVCPDLDFVSKNPNRYIISIYSGYTESLPLAVRYQKIAQKLWNIYENYNNVNFDIIETCCLNCKELFSYLKNLGISIDESSEIIIYDLSYNRVMPITSALEAEYATEIYDSYNHYGDISAMYKFKEFSRYMKSDIFKILAKRLITLYVPRLVLTSNHDISNMSEELLADLKLYVGDCFDDVIDIHKLIYYCKYIVGGESII